MVLLRSLFVGLVSLASLGLARKGPAKGPKELLFYGPTAGKELGVATGTLGYTVNVMTETEWMSLTEADAKTYKAIVFGDPNCAGGSGTPAILDAAINNRAVWSPAVTGNVILIGTDPTYHFDAQPGAKALMEKGIAFAASNSGHTGLYMTLSCYYSNSDETTVQLLDQFGTFRVRGKLSCYNKAHVVAGGGPLNTLTDANLSNWSCSVHEVFFDMPTDFAPLAIAKDITGSGSKEFEDGSKGVPYIVARGIKIKKCGNGKLDKGEECDDGNNVSGDGCSAVCKKEPGPGGSGKCQLCSPYLGDKNQCHITTGCSNTPFGIMCACRPGYKAAGANADTSLHWRLHWSISGHEHRVYVRPGTPCDTLCEQWWAGPNSCLEISEKVCS